MKWEGNRPWDSYLILKNERKLIGSIENISDISIIFISIIKADYISQYHKWNLFCIFTVAEKLRCFLWWIKKIWNILKRIRYFSFLILPILFSTLMPSSFAPIEFLWLKTKNSILKNVLYLQSGSLGQWFSTFLRWRHTFWDGKICNTSKISKLQSDYCFVATSDKLHVPNTNS